MSTESLPISPDLLEILRDPLAIQNKEAYGDDPGRLELVHNCWLVSSDTGLKFPIKDGIPVMLIEEGQKWKDVAVDDLPVPPPPLIPETPAPQFNNDNQAASDTNPILYLAIGALVLVLIIAFFKSLTNGSKE